MSFLFSKNLRFDREEEQAFRCSYDRNSIATVRVISLIGFATYLYLAIANQVLSLGIPVGKIFCYLLGGHISLLVMTFLPGRAKRIHLLTAGHFFVFNCLGEVAFHYVQSEHLVHYGKLGGILLLMVGYTTIRLRFLTATVIGWTTTVAVLAVAYWKGTWPDAEWTVTAEIMVITNFIGMFAAYRFEAGHRRDFKKNRSLAEEKETSEKLLLNILPESVAQRLKTADQRIADSFEDVTVLFADIVGFTEFSDRHSPQKVVGLLNDVFTRFDNLSDVYGLEKIKTIGDAYMAVAGLPDRCPDHADQAARMAVAMQKEVTQFNQLHGLDFKVRIGIHSGPAVAGVIGAKKFVYDLWGDTVNTASRMEARGRSGHVQISEATCSRLKSPFRLSLRGSVEIKGKGAMVTYWLEDELVARGDLAESGPDAAG